MAKPRSYIPLLLTAVLLIAAAATYGVVNSQSTNGKYDADGDKLIEIEYLEQLNAIRYDLDGDGVSDNDSGASAYAAAFPTSAGEAVCESNCNGYELTRSLDFDGAGSYASGAINAAWTTGSGWLPIGVRDTSFNATLEGNGHTVSNLYISRTTTLNNPGSVGLFGIASGSIRNIGIVNTNVTGHIHVGGLAGHNSGTVSDSYATGAVSGGAEVGGLAGSNGGTISGSYSTGSVSGESSEGTHSVGGLVGVNGGTISGSYSTSRVSSDELAGGLAGKNSGTISGSYSTGNVSSDWYVGGLVANNNGSINASYSTGNVSGGGYAGGLTGGNYDRGIISGSYATSAVSGDRENVGGLSGQNSGTIRGSYSAGAVFGISYVGGLVGNNASDYIVGSSYAIGNVSGKERVGGFFGSNSGAGQIIGGFWDTETSDQLTGVGQGNSEGVEGKTTSDLQSPTGYTSIYTAWAIDLDNADQDFDPNTGADDFWDFGTSNQYPVLKVDFNEDGTATWQEFGSQGRVQPTPTQISTPTHTPTPISTPTHTPTPKPTVSSVSGTFVTLSSGANHVCALLDDGSVLCWGDNSQGQTTPPQGVRFKSISSGDTHTCGLRIDGHAIVCWGSLTGTFTKP